jgi:hypothetical protein
MLDQSTYSGAGVDTRDAMLAGWEHQLAWRNKAHEAASRIFYLRHARVGYSAAALSAIVGTTVFASMQQVSAPVTLRVLAIILSLVAAALVAVQTNARYLERSQNHEAIAPKYENLRLETQKLRNSPPQETKLEKETDSISQRWEQLNDEAPRIPIFGQKAADKAVGPCPI